mgnify:CR=1 FL=1
MVVSGPSGVGKTTVVEKLLTTPGFARAVTATTRSPREGEVDGTAVRERREDAFLVFLTAPSDEELERRLRGRGTEEEEVVARRLAAARRELTRRDEYDVTVVNDDLDRAVEEIRSRVEATRRDLRS